MMNFPVVLGVVMANPLLAIGIVLGAIGMSLAIVRLLFGKRSASPKSDVFLQKKESPISPNN